MKQFTQILNNVDINPVFKFKRCLGVLDVMPDPETCEVGDFFLFPDAYIGSTPCGGKLFCCIDIDIDNAVNNETFFGVYADLRNTLSNKEKEVTTQRLNDFLLVRFGGNQDLVDIYIQGYQEGIKDAKYVSDSVFYHVLALEDMKRENK